MTEREKIVCPDCSGDGEKMVETVGLYDGNGYDYPQTNTVMEYRICSTCSGNRWIGGH